MLQLGRTLRLARTFAFHMVRLNAAPSINGAGKIVGHFHVTPSVQQALETPLFDSISCATEGMPRRARPGSIVAHMSVPGYEDIKYIFSVMFILLNRSAILAPMGCV